jgi:hypothetical protein
VRARTTRCGLPRLLLLLYSIARLLNIRTMKTNKCFCALFGSGFFGLDDGLDFSYRIARSLICECRWKSMNVVNHIQSSIPQCHSHRSFLGDTFVTCTKMPGAPSFFQT